MLCRVVAILETPFPIASWITTGHEDELDVNPALPDGIPDTVSPVCVTGMMSMAILQSVLLRRAEVTLVGKTDKVQPYSGVGP